MEHWVNGEEVASAWGNRSALVSGSSCPVAEWFPAAPAISGYFTGRLTYFFLGTSGGRGIIPQASLVTCLITFLFRVGQKLAKGWEEVRVGKIRKKKYKNHRVLSHHVMSFMFQSHSSPGNLGYFLMANKIITAINYPQRQWGPKLSTPPCTFFFLLEKFQLHTVNFRCRCSLVTELQYVPYMQTFRLWIFKDVNVHLHV